jgi:hypothetical protein
MKVNICTNCECMLFSKQLDCFVQMIYHTDEDCRNQTEDQSEVFPLLINHMSLTKCVSFIVQQQAVFVQ